MHPEGSGRGTVGAFTARPSTHHQIRNQTVGQVKPDIERQLWAVTACNELARILKLRVVNMAIEAGWTQREIAEHVLVEHSEISCLANP